jgi:hypothetical protein
MSLSLSVLLSAVPLPGGDVELVLDVKKASL